MSLTPMVAYTRYLLGQVVASGRNEAWLSMLYDPSAFIGDAANVGSIQVPKVSAFTAQTPSDGTLQTNQLNNTFATLTFYDRTVPISLPPSKAKMLDITRPGNLETIGNKAADGLRKVQIAQIIADLVAGTPGITTTLTAGKAEFAGAGATELSMLDRTISYIVANSTALPTDLFILVTPKALGNLMAARNNLVGFTQLGMNADNMLTYGGIPIFPVAATTTAWSGASNACAYVMHKDAYGLATRGVYPHDPDRFWIAEGDGYYKHLDNLTWAGGITETNLYGEIVSNTS